MRYLVTFYFKDETTLTIESDSYPHIYNSNGYTLIQVKEHGREEVNINFFYCKYYAVEVNKRDEK
ncbi:hypothetical protein [Facklamia sp. 7083-14-GEN3]|uniref:hypothetical protein n=1 Tax=Facklamia sp. 7083-14-GEN3 TaxID=2973478 RepID=UPI00215D4264|nr:hypothetical protein [Facklamia sp. 7083-14-GEN3]MCR8969297.1 hypothetical protein [Facklamia sp. 7083-14-GEN3]